MADTILWYILLFAIGAGVLTYGIADDLFHQWWQKKKYEEGN
ncbi:MAG TPA: hypothetical protein VEQ38_17835 [Verrucomicrobiae bacterium]|nr:hypothetical protein [Verrucomicrobiae bacterium]